MKALLFTLPALALLALAACNNGGEDASNAGNATPSPEWKQYSNAELGLTFLYPPDLTYDEFSGPGVNGGGREDYVRFDSPQDRGRVLLFTLIQNTDDVTIDDWVAGNTDCEADTIRETTVAGKRAIECTNTPENLSENAVILARDGEIVFITSVITKVEFDTVIASLEL